MNTHVVDGASFPRPGRGRRAGRALRFAASILEGSRMSPERFGKATPARIKWLMVACYMVSYVLILAVGAIGTTWPSEGLEVWKWATARISGIGAVAGALACAASYIAHKWRWEMFGTLLSGVSLAGYVLVISSIAPLAARGLLLGFATLTCLGVLIRYLHLATRALRWAEAREAGKEHDERHGR